jgi:hypothetical protein
VERHHDPFYSWSGPGVKRWQGEGDAYFSASILSSVIYEVVWRRGPARRRVRAHDDCIAVLFLGIQRGRSNPTSASSPATGNMMDYRKRFAHHHD